MNEKETLLSEATFEQLAREINSRTRDFLLVAHSEDGSHGRHTLLYYSHPYGALGLAVFGKVFLEMHLLDRSEDAGGDDGPVPEHPDTPEVD